MLLPVTSLSAAAYKIPTDSPEADGTIEWSSTTLVLVQIEAGGQTGIGYSYASRACAVLVNDLLAEIVKGRNAFDIEGIWHAMRRALRNLGVTGQAASAIAAIDTALWDLKARLLNVSLLDLMGAARDAMPVYGSGGFTTYDAKRIRAQIDGWSQAGITMAKIKIGAHPEDDLERVRAARKALGDDGQLFVDANGAYDVRQALDFARQFEDYDVRWFEEPVSSDDLVGLRRIRNAAPAGMDITAGEYAWTLFDVEDMIAAEAVDVLQIDATRCQGYTGFMQGAALAGTANLPVSSHCAPALHLAVCCHLGNARHMEYFHDHVRIEHMLFDGVPGVVDGNMACDRNRPGHGMVFKAADAAPYSI